jgi:hypothetical protein
MGIAPSTRLEPHLQAGLLLYQSDLSYPTINLNSPSLINTILFRFER